ncbi:leucine rich repeat [Seminavis robusta]|uniref:Leucine rich repeat n=1 Tax=Seminavis robusta TaxID=568900 RepID=A0A9N8DTE8_9STRA|nr:leucine rich repeat [Seminavis robusta]|eukprot:Sro338_g120850.1 leucine rich repeat (520) ;mRNA; f:40425-42466
MRTNYLFVLLVVNAQAFCFRRRTNEESAGRDDGILRRSLFFLNCGDNDGEDNSENTPPTAAPTESPTPLPTESPTLFPTDPPIDPWASCVNGSPHHDKPIFKDFTPCRSAQGCPIESECCIQTYCVCFEPDNRGVECVPNRDIRSTVQPVALQGGAEWADPESYQAKAIAWLRNDPFSASLSDTRIQQRYALACIYYATYAIANIYTVVEPRGWIDPTGWISNIDECTWFGITCNANSEVEKIVLASNRITGTFPPETTIMASSLTYIDLFRNSVYNSGDAGNAWLGRLTNLRKLFYGQTNFEYKNGIPTQISQLTNLEEYDCSFTRYSGPLVGSTFSPLQNLEYLVLSGNAYNTSIPVEIGNLSNLKFLYVQNASIAGDLSFMEPMQSIIECWVDQNPRLGGPIPTTIGNVQTLQSLSITTCGLDGPIPSELGDLRNMVRMWLHDNMLTGTVPLELGNLFKLQTLALEENLLLGVMPEDICLNRVPLGLLQVLEADCGGATPEIQCDCCTCCEGCLST